MDEALATVLMTLGVCAGIFGLLILSSLINGWALSLLWGWFIVPVFSAPALTLGQAIGIAMVVSFLTYQNFKSDSSLTIADLFLSTFVRPVLVVIFGFAIKLIFGI